MPSARRYRKKRFNRRKGRGKKFAGKKAGMLSPMAGNVATIVETYDAGYINANEPYEIRETLNNYQRASDCARLYQFYRLAKLRLEFQPIANQYIGVVSTAQINYTSVPQMYMMMNRNGSLPNVFDENYLILQGANPKGWTRNIEFTFKPNTLNQVGNQDNNASQFAQGSDIKFNQWISSYLQSTTLQEPTLNQNVEFYGLGFYFKQLYTPSNTTIHPIGSLKVTASWEFKQPASLTLVTPRGAASKKVMTRVENE